MIVDVCVVCVNNDESVLVFGRVSFSSSSRVFFFLTFDQPKKSLSIEFFFLFRIIKISERPTREKKKRKRSRFLISYFAHVFTTQHIY